jgi:hypothetical protein
MLFPAVQRNDQFYAHCYAAGPCARPSLVWVEFMLIVIHIAQGDYPFRLPVANGLFTALIVPRRFG